MWLVILLGSIGHEHTHRDRVAVMELNYRYAPETGKQQFVQMIFWERKPFSKKGRHVLDWRMWGQTFPVPRYSHREKVWQVYWRDKTDGYWRFVEAKSFMVTHTAYDPELEDQKLWPIRHRRGLSEHVQLHRAIPKLLDHLVRAHVRLKHVHPNSICGAQSCWTINSS